MHGQCRPKRVKPRLGGWAENDALGIAHAEDDRVDGLAGRGERRTPKIGGTAHVRLQRVPHAV